MPYTLDDYVDSYGASPYGEAFAAWKVGGAVALRPFDSERLDECAQCARLHASAPYLSGIADALAEFAAACDRIRAERT